MRHVARLVQEDVVKIMEKCSLSSTASSSPAVTPLRTPEDLKSNILKAQAEASAIVVRDRQAHAPTQSSTGCKNKPSSISDIIMHVFVL